LCPPNSMPGAKLCVIEGIGHKFPEVRMSQVIAGIAGPGI